MNTHQTISSKTKTSSEKVGYDMFPIIYNVIPTGELRKTCTMMMLHDWIKSNHNLLVETKFDESQLWGYILWRMDRNDNSLTEVKLSYIDNDSMFETE
jgi:hypothetical protein